MNGDPKQTLGALLKSHGAPLSIPRPLDAAVEKAWDYTSEVGRHLHECREPSAEEAELVTTVCAAVVTCLAGTIPNRAGPLRFWPSRPDRPAARQ
jgi:hypothetical protein